MSADKYTLTKPGKGDVHTSSEAVKHRHLADGFALTENAPVSEVVVTVDAGGLSDQQVADAASKTVEQVAAKPKPGSTNPNKN